MARGVYPLRVTDSYARDARVPRMELGHGFSRRTFPTLATVALNGARRQFASAPDPAVASSLRKAMEAAACNDAAMRLRLFVENYKTQLKGKTPTRHGCGFVHRCDL